MRRIVVVLAACGVLSACGGSSGSESPAPIASSALARQQDAADDVARQVVGTLIADLGAKAPTASSLGRGLYAGCDGGDPDEASYFVDTFVTYDVRAPASAAAQVKQALQDAGLTAEVDAASGDISTSKGDVTVDVSSQAKGGGSAGQNIFVSTGCLAIGKKAIAAFNAKNGRDVPLR